VRLGRGALIAEAVLRGRKRRAGVGVRRVAARPVISFFLAFFNATSRSLSACVMSSCPSCIPKAWGCQDDISTLLKATLSFCRHRGHIGHMPVREQCHGLIDAPGGSGCTPYPLNLSASVSTGGGGREKDPYNLEFQRERCRAGGASTQCSFVSSSSIFLSPADADTIRLEIAMRKAIVFQDSRRLSGSSPKRCQKPLKNRRLRVDGRRGCGRQPLHEEAVESVESDKTTAWEGGCYDNGL